MGKLHNKRTRKHVVTMKKQAKMKTGQHQVGDQSRIYRFRMQPLARANSASYPHGAGNKYRSRGNGSALGLGR